MNATKTINCENVQNENISEKKSKKKKILSL